MEFKVKHGIGWGGENIGINHLIFEGDSEIVDNSLRNGYMLGSAFNHLVRDTVQIFYFSHIFIGKVML